MEPPDNGSFQEISDKITYLSPSVSPIGSDEYNSFAMISYISGVKYKSEAWRNAVLSRGVLTQADVVFLFSERFIAEKCITIAARSGDTQSVSLAWGVVCDLTTFLKKYCTYDYSKMEEYVLGIIKTTSQCFVFF